MFYMWSYTLYSFSLAVDNLKSSEGILDLMGDSEQSLAKQNSNKRKWDPVSHKYVTAQSLQKNQVKKIKSESGHWIPITYKSDRYEKWQEKSKLKNSAAEGNDEEEEKKIAPCKYNIKFVILLGTISIKLIIIIPIS